MELWVRSQDKMKLIKCENIMISKGTFAYEYCETPLCKEYETKDCWYVWANETIIGKYSVEQRALEVLDEIQKTLMPKAIMQQVKLDEYELKLLPEIYVYEMPKE